MEYPSITAPTQGLWGRKLVKQRAVHAEKFVFRMFNRRVDRYVPKRYAQAGSLGSSVSLKYG